MRIRRNLRYALGILEGGSYVDLEENAETTGYRSARTGPAPHLETVDSLTTELDTVCEVVRVVRVVAPELDALFTRTVIAELPASGWRLGDAQITGWLNSQSQRRLVS